MLNSIPISWLHILTACIWVSMSFSFLENSLMSSMYIKWLIFSSDLLSFYPAVHFLRIWFSGIIAITNSNGDSAYPWNMPLWIFIYAKFFPPAVTSWGTLWLRQVFDTFCDRILFSMGTYRKPFSSRSRPVLDFSVSFYSRWGRIDQSSSVPLVPLWHPFYSSAKSPCLISSLICAVSISKCSLCGDRDKTIDHIISRCGNLEQKEYKTRHDWVRKIIH